LKRYDPKRFQQRTSSALPYHGPGIGQFGAQLYAVACQSSIFEKLQILFKISLTFNKVICEIIKKSSRLW
jgi:hypothetical protein